MEGWYYLHTETKDLIYKRELGGTAVDLRESTFVQMLWPMEPSDRAGAWRLLVEALCLGTTAERVSQLALKWGCTDADAYVYARRVGVQLSLDGNARCATRTDFENLQEQPAVFGDSCLEAMAELCGQLGYREKSRKMWGATFHDLLEGRA